MKYINHPLIGDFLYNKKSNLIDRQALHSYMIELVHPISKKDMCFKADIPQDMKKILTKN